MHGLKTIERMNREAVEADALIAKHNDPALVAEREAALARDIKEAQERLGVTTPARS